MGKGNSLLLGGKCSAFLIVKTEQDLGISRHSIVAKSMDSGHGLPRFKPTSADSLDFGW